MALARKAKKVTAIELNPYAVLDAKENLKNNGIENLEIIKADAAVALKELLARPDLVYPSMIVVDPPREGLGPKALEPVLALKPQKLLYISCNPTTQVADIEVLVKNGYRVIRIQPVDQFPHTHHVENITWLIKDR